MFCQREVQIGRTEAAISSGEKEWHLKKKTTATAASKATLNLLFFSQHPSPKTTPKHDSPHVAFCGYSIPHPSEAVVNLRIQTTGEISAAQALRQAAADLKAAAATLRETFGEALVGGEGGAPIAGAPPKVVLAASASKAR